MPRTVSLSSCRWLAPSILCTWVPSPKRGIIIPLFSLTSGTPATDVIWDTACGPPSEVSPPGAGWVTSWSKLLAMVSFSPPSISVPGSSAMLLSESPHEGRTSIPSSKADAAISFDKQVVFIFFLFDKFHIILFTLFQHLKQFIPCELLATSRHQQAGVGNSTKHALVCNAQLAPTGR